MNSKSLDKLIGWYYGFSFFGVFASISMVINFSRMEPAPHTFAKWIIVCCAIATLVLSGFVFSGSRYIKRRQQYGKLIIATYIMGVMIFPLSIIPAVYALRVLKGQEVKELFSKGGTQRK